MFPELFQAFANLPLVALVAGRLAGMVLMQPVLGALIVPMQIRVLLIVGLTLVVAPLAHPPTNWPATLGGLALGLASELLIGALLGLIMRASFIGLEVGGMLIAQESGLAFGQIADPTSGQEQTVLSALYVQLAAVVFLILDGHRAVLTAILDTFATLPLLEGGAVLAGGHLPLVDALGLAFEIGVRVAAPAVLAMFLVNLALGFVGRTVPQLNITTVGFAVKGMLGFLVMASALPAAMENFAEGIATCLDWVRELLDRASNGA